MITNISVVHVKNRYAPKVTILPSNGITKSEGLCFFFYKREGLHSRRLHSFQKVKEQVRGTE